MSVNQGREPLEIPNELEIAAREQGTTIVIEVAGEWDLAGAPAVRHAIDRALTHPAERVVLDLSRLTFMDSSGLHTTIELAHRLAAQDIGLVIVPGSPAVQRLFDLTGLTGRLSFVDKPPTGSRAARPRTAPDGAAGSGGLSLPPNGAGRRPKAVGAKPSAAHSTQA